LRDTQDLVDKFEKEYREGIRQIKKRIAKKTTKENCQEDTQQRYYIDGITRDLIENTGKEWKEIGNDKRKKKTKGQRTLETIQEKDKEEEEENKQEFKEGRIEE